MGHLSGVHCTLTEQFIMTLHLPSSYFPGVYITHLVSSDKRIFSRNEKHEDEVMNILAPRIIYIGW